MKSNNRIDVFCVFERDPNITIKINVLLRSNIDAGDVGDQVRKVRNMIDGSSGIISVRITSSMVTYL